MPIPSKLQPWFEARQRFGLSHIQHAPAPNWRYVALATVAGWFYGLAYRRHRSLMASAGTHAPVDTLWRTFFTLPSAAR